MIKGHRREGSFRLLMRQNSNKGLLRDRRSAEQIQKSQRSAGFELLISGSQLVRPTKSNKVRAMILDQNALLAGRPA
jgi:hypothetical protein